MLSEYSVPNVINMVHHNNKANYFKFISHIDPMSSEDQPLVHAEISVIPLVLAAVDGEDSYTVTELSKYIAKAFDAIKRIDGINAVLTSMGTQIETSDFEKVLQAIHAAHQALRQEGNVKRIISTTRIDERRDKSATINDRIKSVQDKLQRGIDKNPHSSQSK